MNTEYLKEQLDNIMSFRDTYKTSTTEDKYLHNELSKMIRVIKSKIWDEEHDEYNRNRLKTKTIDGVEIVIPEFISGLDDDYEFKHVDNTLYALPSKCSKDEDGSFHEYVYAYIKENDNKHVRFLVRLLGGDRFGDRIFTEANYYKKIESNYKYLNKNYGKDDRFPEKFRKQVETIINEFNKLDGVNDFNPITK
ncbi:hypothetical protein FJQ98_16025 [Lysinibacillus agricola]|uniref:Phage protein n=1 Tax=Lysinibacillus agricola TaxID=2590012 RepID=A0ABX7ALI5_9BACI|nr:MULTISPECIES: hypothetical protein [Lysinibacillus]KOS61548.1 hypothetical protein AN161_18335 [Lysinibacillus sp. FJAT-14222]QQP10753.1 hypothetical protein FJQ98_16025 [Lysinibacillus agricola]